LVIVRRLLVVVLCLLLAAEVVRNSAVAMLAEFRPESAARMWAGHPAVEISLGMKEIAQSARRGQPVGSPVLARIRDAAVKSPLAPEPFLVEGVTAQMSGEVGKAESAFRAAQWRDPRSLPAAYFLTERYFVSGRQIEGLREIANLARLSPAGIGGVAPYLAAYAQNRSNWPRMRELFRSEAEVEDPVLLAMSSDSRNAGAVMALADASHRNAQSQWLPVLVRSLVEDGQYASARAIWADVARVPLQPGQFIYDPSFSKAAAPPPFNWALTSSTVGLAERQPGGRLHVLFYGQEDGSLASELLLLPPGAYRLSMQLTGERSHENELIWSVRCDKPSNELSRVDQGTAASRGWTFEVPANCPAVWLELSGSSSDVPQPAEATIGALSLDRAGPRA
jgi:HAMP domain-containing protein